MSLPLPPHRSPPPLPPTTCSSTSTPVSIPLSSALHSLSGQYLSSKTFLVSSPPTFPDPSNSPAHHVHVLSLCGFAAVDSAGTHACAWVSTFCNIIDLRITEVQWTPSILGQACSKVCQALYWRLMGRHLDELNQSVLCAIGTLTM